MAPLKRIDAQPASLPILADDILEFHAARLLLLILLCGTKNRIDGLTKLAKLDFFVRYPDFFEVAQLEDKTKRDRLTTIESAMVRYHYGPWDNRYYHVLAYLESRGLITVEKQKRTYRFSLTDLGVDKAKVLAVDAVFTEVAARMERVKRTFGGKTGTYLKKLIYSLFDEEVARRRIGEVID